MYVLYTNVVYICICIHTYTDINLAGVGCGSLARKVYCFGHYIKKKICIHTCTFIYTCIYYIRILYIYVYMYTYINRYTFGRRVTWVPCADVLFRPSNKKEM